MEFIGILSLLALYKFLDMSSAEERAVEIIDMNKENINI